MVDEPLHVASSCWLPAAGPRVAVAQGPRVGPRVDVPRVDAAVAPRLCADVAESAGERRWPLSGVSGVVH